MIIVMKPNSKEKHIQAVIERIESAGLAPHLSQGSQVTIIGVVGDKNMLRDGYFRSLAGVEKVVSVTESYKLANKKFHPEPTVVKIGDLEIGGKNILVMAGPCAIESRDQLIASAIAVKKAGGHVLRGGAYKPRTSPYAFQGLEEEGLRYMAEARDQTGLKTICEVTSIHAVETAIKYVDCLQVGARNMQNYELLKAIGKTQTPVLLKRGLSATIDEWLNAAEYIMSEGNLNVILCERGIRTFETSTRNTLDISAVPIIKSKSHLPIVVDPSHASGVLEYIPALAAASIAAGADGLIIEVHPDPAHALSDGPQSLPPEEFEVLMNNLRPIAKAVGRTL